LALGELVVLLSAEAQLAIRIHAGAKFVVRGVQRLDAHVLRGVGRHDRDGFALHKLAFVVAHAPVLVGVEFKHAALHGVMPNHLLRSVDRKCNHVLYEKLISPNQNGGLTGVATSFIEEINVRINKDITFQSAAHTYGAKGAWTNLHVAILAYDVKLSQYTLVDDATATVNAERDAAMEIVDHTEQLGLGFTGKSLASRVAVSDLSCEYTIYFKEA